MRAICSDYELLISAPMKILALDTSLAAAAACVYDAERGVMLSAETMPMERGHAEALLPLVDRIVEQGGGFAGLSRVASTIGPGSFTGIRVGIAAARAIALACGIPSVGVSTLAALAAPLLKAGETAAVLAAIDARHGQVYAQGFGPQGQSLFEATVCTPRQALELARARHVRLVGSGAAALAIEAWTMGLNAEPAARPPMPDIAYVARLAAMADPAHAPARPLYLKAASVTPQAAAAPPAG